jgi:hypothetical protein
LFEFIWHSSAAKRDVSFFVLAFSRANIGATSSTARAPILFLLAASCWLLVNQSRGNFDEGEHKGEHNGRTPGKHGESRGEKRFRPNGHRWFVPFVFAFNTATV